MVRRARNERALAQLWRDGQEDVLDLASELIDIRRRVSSEPGDIVLPAVDLDADPWNDHEIFVLVGLVGEEGHRDA